MVIKNWHVFQVLVGKEDKILGKINFDGEVFAFTPKRVKFLRKEGKPIRIEEILFRGYVIVETEMDYLAFKNYANNVIKPLEGVIRLLEHDRIGTESILPHERAFIEKYTSPKRIIEPSYGFIQGDKVVITDGPLMGRESEIIRIDRHKRLAELCVNMFGEVQRIKVSCEILSKTI